MDRYAYLDPLRVTPVLRGTRRRGVMAALAVLVAGALVAAALLVSNAGQARHGVAAHPAEAVLMGGHGPGLERGGGWQHLTPLY
jgi:hypothetical protein